MRLQVDPESMRQLGNGPETAARLQRYYECVNKAYECVVRTAA
jgi:hypothetical protein